MSTHSNIQRQFLLHETAIELLRIINNCRLAGDHWGVEHFSGMYASTMNELTEAHVKKALGEFLTEEELEEIFNAGKVPELSREMWVGKNNYQLFTPENE